MASGTYQRGEDGRANQSHGRRESDLNRSFGLAQNNLIAVITSVVRHK